VSNDNQPNIDWQQGYGYQFWRSQYGAYRGDGAFGQYCVVLPDHDATLIITSASPDMQEVLNLVWQYLLPALQGSDTPVGTRPEKLEILAPTGPAPKAGDGRTYRFESNDAGLAAVRLDPDSTGTFTFEADGATQDVVCGPGPWRELRDELRDPAKRLVTSAYGDGETFVATFRYLETPFVLTFNCRPDGENLVIDAELNVGFGPNTFTLMSTS
jgi:hypothetical protein